jgi:membrane associated rhomboid family serine protease
VFPLRDENPTTRAAWLTWAIIALNVAVFGYEIYITGAYGTDALQVFIYTWGFTPSRFLADPFSPLQWATVFTSMFIHAGWLHIGGNMLYLWIFGNNVEDRLGPLRYLGFYLACGVAAAAAQLLSGPGADLPQIGASGAIAGVLGAYVLLYPRARVITALLIIIVFDIVALPAWFVIIMWFVLQLAEGITGLGRVAAQAGGVAYFAHIGGFVTGVVLILPAWLADRYRSAKFRTWR